MDIYSYAMQMEKNGEIYYREIAGKAKSKGIRNVLLMLADAEVKHYQIFEHMKRHEVVQPADLAYLGKIKNIFVQMREGQEPLEVNGSQIVLYRKAQDIEKKTRDFYREKSAEVDEAQRTMFLKIADEEQKHYDILENIIDVVTRPETWLENPEWYHLEEY